MVTGPVQEGWGVSELTKSSRRIPMILPRTQVRGSSRNTQSSRATRDCACDSIGGPATGTPVDG